MGTYDFIRKWKRRIAIRLNTMRLRIISYRNIRFSGLEDIHISTQIYGRLDGTVSLGKRISSCRNCTLVSVGGNLSVGDYSYFSDNCSVVCHEKINIGSHCMFGPNSCIYDHDHRFGAEGVLDGYKTSPIIIENNCWIGANVTILRGTHIGEGCVIGAGAVIKGDIPAHSRVVCKGELCIKPIAE